MSFLIRSAFEQSDINFEKLYLDSRTADTHFVLDMDTDHPQRVPAHKIILSIRSPVFDTMFYGSLPEMGDIPIADASAAAFKEFLQHFYLPEVKLTSKHIIEVMNLCKKYELTDDLEKCEESLKLSLSFEDICWGYALALHLELKKLTEFCKVGILNGGVQVLSSQSILDCNKKLFIKILSEILNSGNKGKCVINVVVACMEWAKAECSRNDLEGSSQNIRTQLGDLYHQIPFDKLETEEFHQFVATYRGFFSIDELESLIQRQILKKKTNPFNIRYLPICDRQMADDSSGKITEFSSETTTFISNKSLLLKEIHVDVEKNNQPFSGYHYEIQSKKDDIIVEDTVFHIGRSILKCILSKSIHIEPNKMYRIIFKADTFYKKKPLRDEVFLENDVKIKFEGDIVSRLVFEKEQE